MVEFVGHTLMDRTVSDNINEHSLFVDGHVGGKMLWAMASERSLEEVSGFASVSVCVWHLNKKEIKYNIYSK